jgi:uncharacterized membrane protein YhaH (DUF805 family)
MRYIRRLPNKAWWILLGLAIILSMVMMNLEIYKLFGKLIWIPYIIWFMVFIGSSKELKTGIKILYFTLFYWLLIGLSLAIGLLIAQISMLGMKH